MSNYQYTSNTPPDTNGNITTNTGTTAIAIELPIVTTEDINGLVYIIGMELLDLNNPNAINCIVTTITYFPDEYDNQGNIVKKVKGTEQVPLSRTSILTQIADLEYRLLLYKNAATTKDELELVSNTIDTISSWKSSLTVVGVVPPQQPNIRILPLDKTDPDYLIILYYLDYILFYKYITVTSQWLTVYDYIGKINVKLDCLKKKYLGDLELIAFETTINTAISRFKECSLVVPPVSSIVGSSPTIEFITDDNIMEDLITDWKITSPIAYFNITLNTTYFSFNAETIVPKSYTLEQLIAAVALNCKLETQRQYDLWSSNQTGDWLASMNLKSYLNMVTKLGTIVAP